METEAAKGAAATPSQRLLPFLNLDLSFQKKKKKAP
jgi:hypothetical protein